MNLTNFSKCSVARDYSSLLLVFLYPFHLYIRIFFAIDRFYQLLSVDLTDSTFQIESKRQKTAQRQDDLNHRKIDYNVNMTSDSTAMLQTPKLRPPVNISYTVSIFRIPCVDRLFLFTSSVR